MGRLAETLFALVLPLVSTAATACPFCYQAARQMMTEGVQLDSTEIIPVDLNAVMFGLENAIREGCEREGDHDCAEDYSKRAAARRAAIDRYLWDPSRGAYLDYRWTKKQPIDHVTAATLYPLFTRVASEAQAASVAKAVEVELLKPGGSSRRRSKPDSNGIGRTGGRRCNGSRSKG